MKSGNINFLEPSGPLQACNGTALPLHFYLSSLAVSYRLPLSMYSWDTERSHWMTFCSSICGKSHENITYKCGFDVTVGKHSKYNSWSKFNVQTTGIHFVLHSKYTECFGIKYAGLITMFPLFMQRVRKEPLLDIRMPSHASFLATTTHNAGCTHAEYQCPVFSLTRIHERLCIPELENFKFWRLLLHRVFIRRLSNTRFGYPEGGLNKREECKKLFNFLYVKFWTGSPAARWRDGELAQLRNFDIIYSFVVDVLSKKTINILTQSTLL